MNWGSGIPIQKATNIMFRAYTECW